MLETEENKYICDDVSRDSSFSVYSSAAVLTDVSPVFAVPETAQDAGLAFSVSSSDSGLYRWLKPTSRRFAEVFITVSSRLAAVWHAAKRFVARAAHHVRMSLVVRRTVCLRL